MAAKEDVPVSGDVFTCSLVCTHVWGCTYAHVHGEQRPAISIFLSFSPPYFSKQGLSLNLALTNSDSGQTVSPLSLPPQLWDYRCTLFNLAFMCVLGEAGGVPWCRWVSEDNMEGKLVLSIHSVGPENQPRVTFTCWAISLASTLLFKSGSWLNGRHLLSSSSAPGKPLHRLPRSCSGLLYYCSHENRGGEECTKCKNEPNFVNTNIPRRESKPLMKIQLVNNLILVLGNRSRRPSYSVLWLNPDQVRNDRECILMYSYWGSEREQAHVTEGNVFC